MYLLNIYGISNMWPFDDFLIESLSQHDYINGSGKATVAFHSLLLIDGLNTGSFSLFSISRWHQVCWNVSPFHIVWIIPFPVILMSLLIAKNCHFSETKCFEQRACLLTYFCHFKRKVYQKWQFSMHLTSDVQDGSLYHKHTLINGCHAFTRGGGVKVS